MAGLSDDERRADAHEAARLPQDDLELAGIAFGRELLSPPRGLNVVQPDDPPLRLGHDLLGHDQDITVFEVGGLVEQSGKIVPLPHLGYPLDGEDADPVHFRPTRRIPACVL
jgi:hypothetical protein